MLRILGAVVLILMFALPNLSLADSLDAYLLTALDDTPHGVAQESEKTVHPGVSRWIEEAQLRFQAEDDLKNTFRNGIKNSYTLRVTPKYSTQSSAEQSIDNLSTTQRALDLARLGTKALKIRYRMLIDFSELRAKTLFEQQHINLLKIEVNLNRALANTAEFKPENLQQLNLELSHSNATLHLANKRLQAMQERILADSELPYSPNTLLNDDWPLRPRAIEEVLSQHQAVLADTSTYPQIRQARINLDLATASLAIVKTKTSLALDLIGIEYSNEQRDNSIGVLLGFNLPTGGGGSRLIDRRHDRARARTGFMFTRDSVAGRMTELLSNLKWNFSAWKTDDTADQNIHTLSAEPTRAQQPQLVIGLKRQRLALNRSMSATHMQLLRDYIEVLGTAGILGKGPLRNWIKVGQPTLQK